MQTGRAGDCSQAGQEKVFTSADGRIAVRVFSTLGRSVRITILPVDPNTVAGLSGLVDALVFQIVGGYCEGGAFADAAAEVNLGVHYSDQDAAGRNESNFTIALRDPTDNTWQPPMKQAADPGNNYVSATITRLGYYAVYER